MAHTNAEEVITEFFGDAPRASEWRALREALGERLRALRRQRDQETDAARRSSQETQIAVLARQVATLETEEVVARFVEDSIQATLARAPDDFGEGEFEGDG